MGHGFGSLLTASLPPHHPPPSPRALLVVAEQNGNHLRECWTEVLRCVSRFELLQQLTAGVPTDALLFAMPDKVAGSAADKLKRRILRGRGREEGAEGGLAHDSFSSINDMGLHASETGWPALWSWEGLGALVGQTNAACSLPSCMPGSSLTLGTHPCRNSHMLHCPVPPAPPRHAANFTPFTHPAARFAATREVDKKHLPPAEVMASVDVQELNRLFVNSGRLDSEAIVQFVKTLSAISAEELRPVACPRVFSLTKIVEIAHFNMGRIR